MTLEKRETLQWLYIISTVGRGIEKETDSSSSRKVLPKQIIYKH